GGGVVIGTGGYPQALRAPGPLLLAPEHPAPAWCGQLDRVIDDGGTHLPHAAHLPSSFPGHSIPPLVPGDRHPRTPRCQILLPAPDPGSTSCPVGVPAAGRRLS